MFSGAKLLPYLACLLVGCFIGLVLQARVLAKPCPTVAAVKCPDCNCPEIKPCPPQIDMSKFKADKKGRYTFNLYLGSDTTKKK